MYSYTVGGRTTKKKLSNHGSLEARYGWDNEGKMTWVKYPDTCEHQGDPYQCVTINASRPAAIPTTPTAT